MILGAKIINPFDNGTQLPAMCQQGQVSRKLVAPIRATSTYVYHLCFLDHQLTISSKHRRKKNHNQLSLISTEHGTGRIHSTSAKSAASLILKAVPIAIR